MLYYKVKEDLSLTSKKGVLFFPKGELLTMVEIKKADKLTGGYCHSIVKYCDVLEISSRKTIKAIKTFGVRRESK